MSKAPPFDEVVVSKTFDEVAESESETDPSLEAPKLLPDPLVFAPDVPGYLGLPEGDDRDEARRAWVLALLNSSEGVLSPSWKEDWGMLEQALKDGTDKLPKPNHSRKPGVVKGGLNG